VEILRESHKEVSGNRMDAMKKGNKEQWVFVGVGKGDFMSGGGSGYSVGSDCGAQVECGTS